MKIRKAVITAAGWGTRFLPATKAQPKEMLPLVDRPAIQYIVEEAAAAGIEQIVVVTALGKRSIEDHFDRSFELETLLDRKGDARGLQAVRRLTDLVDVVYIRQHEQLGLGHAIKITREIVGDEPFAVFLPDDIIIDRRPAIGQMIEVYDRYESSVLAVRAVDRELTSAYGVIDADEIEPNVFDVKGLVEKPAPDNAPSNLAIVGRYILTPEIFAALESIGPGSGGEIQLTDGIAELMNHQKVYAYAFSGSRYDTGTPLGLLKASIEIALRRPDISTDFREYLGSLDTDAFDSADLRIWLND